MECKMDAAMHDTETKFIEVISIFGNRKFSTDDFVERLKSRNQEIYSEIVKKYGQGGKGAGSHYSSNSWISQQLNRLSNKGIISKLDYEKAPKHYGSPIIRYWANTQNSQIFPEEPIDPEIYFEGALKIVKVNKYERDPKAREACINHWKAKCNVCEFDFGNAYGDLGRDFIHVHHITPISSIGREYVVNPIEDLRPVCPNCHAMLHRTNPPLSPEQLKTIISEVKTS